MNAVKCRTSLNSPDTEKRLKLEVKVKKEAKGKSHEEMTRGKHSTERQLEKTGRNYKQERLKEREERKNRTYNP
jgi:hypothetical protein